MRLCQNPLICCRGAMRRRQFNASQMRQKGWRNGIRPFRTVKFGVNYLTDIGFGARGRFEHRNLSGKENTLEVALPISEVGVGLESFYRMPDFFREDHALQLRAKVGVEDTDAYEVRTFTLGGGLVGVSGEGDITQLVKVRPRPRDSGLVAWEVPWRESKMVKPSDHVLKLEYSNALGCNVQ